MEKDEKKRRDEKIYEMYKSGMSMSAIGKELNIDKGNLSRIFKKSERLKELLGKKESLSVKKLVFENRVKIREMLNEGLSLTAIAETLGCKRSTLYYWLYERQFFYE